jgi:uncharacterized protein (TIGR02594 family)
MISDSILKIAVAELGQKEMTGAGNNLHIVNYAKEAGFTWINDDETPWCSIFVNWVARKAGLKGTNKTNARSWLLTGQPVDNNPEPGDVVVFWREQPDSWKGHVGFFLGFSVDKSRVYCIGGNQGDQVSLSAFPSDTVLGFRRLSYQQEIVLPDIILRKADTGDNVKSLQDALKSAGIDCGTSDGIFGPLTETAVKKLQSMKTGLTINGIFDSDTRKLLSEILRE